MIWFVLNTESEGMMLGPTRFMLGPARCLVREIVVDQFVVRTAGWATLGVALVKPEPHDCSVVFFTQAAHHPLGANTRHNVGILFCSQVVFWLQNAVWILSLLQSLQGPALESGRLLVISWNALQSRHSTVSWCSQRRI